MPKTQVYKEPLFVRWNWGFSFTLGRNVLLVPSKTVQEEILCFGVFS